MAYKTLDLTLISAKDLKSVNLIGKMDVYVVVSLSGDPKSKQKTRTHQDGGTKPHWDQTLRFTFDEAAALNAAWTVNFQIKHDAFGPDKDVGEVRVPIRELIDGFRDKRDAQFLTYQVRGSSGKPQGELKISYRISDLQQPAAAYPPQACSSSAAAYPPPSAGYAQGAYPPPHGYPAQGYPQAPPPQGYAQAYPQAPAQGYGQAYPQAPPQGYPQAYPPQGYPPAPYGGYPPQQQPGYGYGQAQGQHGQKPKKSGGLGMGLGAGLIGGAVGGLLLGEMVSDIGDDGGFDF